MGKESSKSSMESLKNMKDITENVYWQRNIKTRRNSNIANQVIPKTTTDKLIAANQQWKCNKCQKY